MEMLFQAELWQPCPTIERSLNPQQQPQTKSQDNISLQSYYSYSIQCTMYTKSNCTLDVEKVK